MPNGLVLQERHPGARRAFSMRDVRELNINEGGRPVQRPAPTNEQIAAFEARFGLELPEEYLLLLQASNGGHPEVDSFRPVRTAETGFWGVNRFYHLADNKTDPEGVWFATEEWQAATQRKLVSVANDGSGNQIVLSYETSPPCVLVCIHDEGFRMVYVADTFSQFLDLLVADSDMI
jgi:hypothetical protein